MIGASTGSRRNDSWKSTSRQLVAGTGRDQWKPWAMSQPSRAALGDLLVLDALGDDVEVELVSQVDDRLDQRRAARVLDHPHDERAVDLQRRSGIASSWAIDV